MKQNKKWAMQAGMWGAVLSGLVLTSVVAIELPKRQPGLWKQTHHDKANAQPTDVIYQCVDETSDEKFQSMAKAMAGGDNCTEETFERRGDTWVGHSVCQVMGSRVTHDYVVSGNFKTEFRVESRSQYQPPLFGDAQTASVMVAEWQGPCKPGQKPGDMMIEQDGETETINVDDLGGMSEMLEQLQKMQSQAGGAGVDMQELGKMLEQLQQMQPSK